MRPAHLSMLFPVGIRALLALIGCVGRALKVGAIDKKTKRELDGGAPITEAAVTRQGGDGSPARGKSEPAPGAQRLGRGPTPAAGRVGRRPETRVAKPDEVFGGREGPGYQAAIGNIRR